MAGFELILPFLQAAKELILNTVIRRGAETEDQFLRANLSGYAEYAKGSVQASCPMKHIVDATLRTRGRYHESMAHVE